MNGTDLFNKAVKACYDYRAVYGKFPDKIGIHIRQLGLLPPQIFFPNPPLIEIARLTDDISLAGMTIDQHQTFFEPVAGPDILWDEVYFPLPGSEQKAISSEKLARLAKEFE